MTSCTCPKSDIGWDENCLIHGLAASAASEAGKRPDAVPPKRTPEETRGEHEIGFCWCGAHHDVPPPSDAAQPKETCACRERCETWCQEMELVAKAARIVESMLPEDEPDHTCAWVYRVAVQVGLAAHPEDAPGGPWCSENIGDADRSWGPTVWDSRVDAEGYGVTGTSRFYFATLPLAEAVRDVLNRDFLCRLKGETDG